MTVVTKHLLVYITDRQNRLVFADQDALAACLPVQLDQGDGGDEGSHLLHDSQNAILDTEALLTRELLFAVFPGKTKEQIVLHLATYGVLQTTATWEEMMHLHYRQVVAALNYRIHHDYIRLEREKK